MGPSRGGAQAVRQTPRDLRCACHSELKTTSIGAELGKIVNRAELSAIFGVAVTTIDAWVRNGCPYVQKAAGKGKSWQFDTAAVAGWREKRAADEASGSVVADEAALKRRKLIADVLTAEMEAAEKRGLVAPVAGMQRATARLMAEIQGNLRGVLVTRLVRQLLGETDERTFKRITLAEVDVILDSLAKIDADAIAEGEN